MLFNKIKMISMFISIFMLITLCNNTFARTGWTGRVNILEAYQINQNKIAFKLSRFNNPAGCSPSDNIHVAVEVTSMPQTLFYMNLAFGDGKQVDLWILDQCMGTHWTGVTLGVIGHVKVFR